MLRPLLSLSLFLITAFSFAAAFANDKDSSPLGELQFSDQFERDESVPGKEEVGEGWTTNSPWRAHGNQQVDLVDGAIHITRYPTADHGVAVFHPVDFEDGAVQLRFHLRKRDQLGVDFADKELKTVHAGHLFIVRVTLANLTLQDSKTGRMNLENRKRIASGDKSPELRKLLDAKKFTAPLNLTPDKWYTLLIQVQGDVLTVSIDGKEVGQLKSEGIAHPTKRHISLAVEKEAWVDDVKIWKAK
ncbi:hypothetical protein Pan97_05310 [Bremerella volcania]|uniref:3-keto-alpha-glucoside-1,2-lyase/3-keto-2-hydroxy-glucal hydratase domain-containing protein n=1 Tax=Bremerella volcania TaxID=2527984 RepID=A0A518C2V9_9BACT|nr:family 16 glycoside hydrolase [Bremerella volcania]QDU73555.1 hypothetical protein Pan97_05310 [Bremerella volcania]